MRGSFATAWAAVLIVSCAASETRGPPAMFASGSRLRARVVEGDEGARVFLGWHDSALEIDCSFELAADGELRCLPDVPSSTVFLDPECTQHAYLSEPGVAVPSQVRALVWSPPEACVADRWTVGALGEEREERTVYAWSGPAGCVPRALVDGARIFAVGEERPPGTFVRATLEDQPRTARLAARLAIADDGAREMRRIVDRDRDAPCAVLSWLLPDRCIPLASGWVIGDFLDPSCTTPSAYSSFAAYGESLGPPCLPEPLLLMRVTCGTELFEVGTELDAAYERGPEGCERIDPSSRIDRRLWSVGAPLSPDTLPEVDIAADAGGRLAARVHVAADGTPLQQVGDFFDHDLGTACAPDTFCDGTRRCVPTDDAAPVFFDDPDCSRPVIQRSSPACGRESQRWIVERGEWWCVRTVYATGERVDVDALYVLDPSGACSLVMSPDPAVEHYRIEPLATDRFATVVERVE